MIFKKGEGAKKLPQFERIEAIRVEGDFLYAGQLVSLAMLASFRREQTSMPPNRWYFCVHDGHLHIYPYPEKPLRVRVRILVAREI